MSARATRAPNWRPTPSSSSAKALLDERRSATLRSAIASGFLRLLRSRATWIIAVGDAELHKVGFRNAERLVDGRDDLDDLIVEMPVVGLRDFGQIVVGDSLAVLVEHDLAGRGVQGEMRQRVAKLGLIAGHIAVHLVERREQRLRFDVIALRE